MELPIKFYRNNRWFANLEWYLFKYFHIKRKIPCGRTKKIAIFVAINLMTLYVFILI